MSPKSTSAGTPAGETPSYEQARDELVAIVSALEAGGVSLEESIALWERGEELAAICQRWLDGARARLDSVIQSGGDADSDDAPSADSASSES